MDGMRFSGLVPLVAAGVIAVAAGAGAGYWAGSRAKESRAEVGAPDSSPLLRVELDALAERLTALERAQLLDAVEGAANSAAPPREGEAPSASGGQARAGRPGDDSGRERFGALGSRWMETLAELQATSDPQKRRALARELAKSPVPPLRLEGFRTLLELDPDEGLAAVREMVADAARNPRTQRMAGQAVLLLSDVPGNAVDQDLYTYAQSQAFEVQRAALRTLERRGDAEPIRAAIATQQPGLQSPDAGTRTRALREIGALRSQSATSVIVPLLSDADSGVRIQALEALGRTGGGAPALAAVQPLLSDSVPAVRDTAVRTVRRLDRGPEELDARGGFRFER